MNEKTMKTVSGSSLLTGDQIEQLNAPTALPDSAIDTSDIPELTDEDFAASVRLGGRSVAEVMTLYKVRKAPITARIDLDVLEWLKSQGDGYQTRLNSILRAAMVKDLRQHQSHK